MLIYMRSDNIVGPFTNTKVLTPYWKTLHIRFPHAAQKLLMECSEICAVTTFESVEIALASFLQKSPVPTVSHASTVYVKYTDVSVVVKCISMLRRRHMGTGIVCVL